MEKIVYLYLVLKKVIMTKYIEISNMLFDIKSVHYVDKNNSVKNGIVNYYYICFINGLIHMFQKIIDLLVKLRNLLDVQTESVQIVKSVNKDNTKTFILSSKINNESKLSINTVKDYMNDNIITKDSTMSRTIFLRFEIMYPNNETVSINDLIIKYRDINGNYDHTLKNILKFCNIKTNDECRIKTQSFNNGKVQTNIYPINEVYDKHINFFNKL